MIARTCLLITAVLVAAPACGQSLKRLEQLAASAHGFRADFTYTVSSAYWDDQQEMHGSLVLQGVQYRVETESEVILSHGLDTYVYRPLDNQVLITATEPTLSPATLFGDFEEHYEIASTQPVTYQGTRHLAVVLLPRDSDSSILEVRLWVRSTDEMVIRIQSVDVNETTMDFELTNIDLRPQIGPDTFELSFPESAEMIDLRS